LQRGPARGRADEELHAERGLPIAFRLLNTVRVPAPAPMWCPLPVQGGVEEIADPAPAWATESDLAQSDALAPPQTQAIVFPAEFDASADVVNEWVAVLDDLGVFAEAGCSSTIAVLWENGQ
jgi:hypothetical protein